MAVVAALFANEAEAERAIEALAGTAFEALEVTIYGGGLPDDAVETRAAGTPDSTGTLQPAAGAQAALADILDSLPDEALAGVFEQAMQERGCVLLVAVVADEKAVDLAAFLQKLGGRATLDD